ncbi:lysine-specific demethylase lid [Schistocerca nitens]|uniref:lysine-specific demethylase lid n=1 Tax=Schistocerca nitens TaxID=7011 RepID=UPI00211793C1|nr:lysine-specific demethylase lid [Schistocerca nitens]
MGTRVQKSLSSSTPQRSGNVGEFDFKVPQEAPVFYPSVEEFGDPLAYINKIRPVAEKTGICKIKPPPDWQPPFTVNVDKFKFTPRIQRLNELEAKTRIKLNYLDQIAKFWELQGSSLKIPQIEKKVLDIYSLHTMVKAEGGADAVTAGKKWDKLAVRMGWPANRGLGAVLKHHYERILYPFDVFQQGKVMSEIKKRPEIDDSDREYKQHGIPSRQAIKPPQRKYGRRARYGDLGDVVVKEENTGEPSTKSKELRRLQIFGAGPKMPGYENKGKGKHKMRGKKQKFDVDPLAKYVCQNCNRGDVEESMLLCDGCDDSYHTFCLMPPLAEIPRGDWRCPRCVAVEVNKPVEAFGFEQAQREYTLQQFGEMADQFKSDYFNMPVHMVPSSLVEREFWRVVSSIDEDVIVEYGADLHTMDHGSGFPTKATDMDNKDEKYTNSGWNLNNIAVLEGSVLGHINADISGMKVPWMYVGMCFATFCWHNEDHWSYSINYLHWGESKTWYGVPGSKAEMFEDVMKQAAPELFQSQPDLLHQLVTIMNPNILMDAGVPIYRTDQKAGEFVVTFPRAYHAGFNQGYNFAEAVNFAPADWIQMGRECILHYSTLRRFCVFSHDELVCKMSLNPEALDLRVAAATYKDMLKMVEIEKKHRKELLDWGCTLAQQEPFELIPDDERQCEVCKTTCFLSAVTCSCNKDILVCLRHFKQLCECPPNKHTLRYRYTLDELPNMLYRLKLRAESFDIWAESVKNAMDPKASNKTDLEQFKRLLEEAKQKRFPESELLTMLSEIVQEGEKCAKIAQQICCKTQKPKTRQDNKPKLQLTLQELKLFNDQIEDLPCAIKEAPAVKQLLERVQDFKKTAADLLSKNLVPSKDLIECLEAGNELDFDLPEMPKLRQYIDMVKWMEDIAAKCANHHLLTKEKIKKLLADGTQLVPHEDVETKLAELRSLLTQVERWEERAKQCLQENKMFSVMGLKRFIEEGEGIKASLNNFDAISEIFKKAKVWLARVREAQQSKYRPYIDLVEAFVICGKSIPVHLEALPYLETQFSEGKLWREKLEHAFLKKNSPYSVMEVISPRLNLGDTPKKQRRIQHTAEVDIDSREPYVILNLKLEGDVDPSLVVSEFKKAEKIELEQMHEIRTRNTSKIENNTFDTYCICDAENDGEVLYQCGLCRDLFHEECVPCIKPFLKYKTMYTSHDSSFVLQGKFLCPDCCRSKRPRLETLLTLLVQLQKINIRIPEAEALQCFTERIMGWQVKVRKALNTGEFAMALSQISQLSKKIGEAVAREKTEKIISDELEKCSQLGNVRPSSVAIGQPEELPSQNVKLVHKLSSPDREKSEQYTEDISDTVLGDEQLEPAPKRLKSLKKSSKPFIVLSKKAQKMLEDLMMEGDLMEVTLDEALKLGKIYQATILSRDQIEEVALERCKMSGKKSYSYSLINAYTSIRRQKSETKSEPEQAESKKKVKGPSKRKSTCKGQQKKRSQGVSSTSKTEEDSDTQNDEDEDCAAVNCLKPVGQSVDWVQCDGGCEKWFHLYCVGLDKQDVNPHEDYICVNCTNRRNCGGIDSAHHFTSDIVLDVDEEEIEVEEVIEDSLTREGRLAMDVEEIRSAQMDSDISIL